MRRSTGLRFRGACAAHVIDDSAHSDLFALCKRSDNLKDIIYEMCLDLSLALGCDLSIVFYDCGNLVVGNAECKRTCPGEFIRMGSCEGHHQTVIHL